MATGASTPASIDSDVAATAASVASREHRTVTEQINHWARLGMQVERSAWARSRQALADAAGDAQFSTLIAEERAVAHATIDTRITERAAARRFGSAARTARQVTVAIDEHGALIEIAPDGGRRLL